jgi:FkbM family methyltransferase
MIFGFFRVAVLLPMVGAHTVQIDETETRLRLSDNDDDNIGLLQTVVDSLGTVASSQESFASRSHARMARSSSRPCTCESENSDWSPPARTHAKCVFIDLGAADGNTFIKFLNSEYGQVSDCLNSGNWEAFLVEANPVFEKELSSLEEQFPGRVHALAGKAAYMCKGETTFFVDNDPTHNYWGSNMEGGKHPPSDWKHPNQLRDHDVVHHGTNVTVPLVNVPQLLYENSISADYTIMKMDVEGAEWDIVPCMSRSQAVKTLDDLHMEVHPATWQIGNTTPAEMEAAQQQLIQKGVSIPKYYSAT